MQLASVWQIQLQLRGAELEQAWPYLDKGLFGLEVIDFASPQVLNDNWSERLQELQALYAQLPGPISLHGPFLDLSPASPDPMLRQLTKHRYLQALKIAQALGARYLVLHSQFNPNLRDPSYPVRWLAGTRQFFLDLLPAIEAAQTTIVLENMWDPCPDHLAALLHELPAEQFAACFDIAHANLFSPVPVAGWVNTLGDRLAYVHLSDNHGGYDEHLTLGAGSVDLAALLAALRARQLQPWFVLEVKRWEEVKNSLAHLERVACYN